MKDSVLTFSAPGAYCCDAVVIMSSLPDKAEQTSEMLVIVMVWPFFIMLSTVLCLHLCPDYLPQEKYVS